jgi:NAD-dependent SIR2 family protein deacetylase
MGTSLKVSPFNFLPQNLPKDTWRIVVNKEKVGQFKYEELNSNDLFLEGTTDEIILKIVDDCGWKSEFDKFLKDHN